MHVTDDLPGNTDIPHAARLPLRTRHTQGNCCLPTIMHRIPPGTLPGDEKLNHDYLQTADDSYGTEGASGDDEGFDLVQENSQWGFELDQNPTAHAGEISTP